MTHDLISDMLSELDVSCTRVAVTELRENTFYAAVTLQLNGREIEIDSRPSDALALAVTGAPIFAAEDVITESAIEFEHEVEDQEEVVEKFKDFLDNVARGLRGGRGRGAVAAYAAARVSARLRIRPTSSSKPIPAASAAWGRRLVSVRPGIGLASSTWRSPPPSSIRSTARSRSSPGARTPGAPIPGRARSRPREGRPGQTNDVRPIS